MSALAHTKQKFHNIIKFQERQRIFKKIRERHLESYDQNEHFNGGQQSELSMLLKRSLIKNQLLEDIRSSPLLTMLKEKITHINNIQDFEYMLSILTNLIGDSLSLEQQQEIAQLLIYLYNNQTFLQEFNEKSYNLNLFRTVLSNVCSFNSILHFIDEDLAMKCQNIILNLSETIISKVISLREVKYFTEEESSSLEKISLLIMELFQKYLHSNPEYVSQITYKFNRNIQIFQKIFNSHKKISKMTQKSVFLGIIHKGLMLIYELLSEKITTSDYPLFFEQPELIMLPIDQIITSNETINIKISLHLVINILSKYLDSGLLCILESVNSSFLLEKRQTLFKKLMETDVNSYFKLNFIKLMLVQESFFMFMESIFDKYWKELVDCCIETLKPMEDIEEMKIALQVLLILASKKSAESFYNYLMIMGSESLLEHIMFKTNQLFPQENKEELNDINAISGYLLFEIKKYQ